MAKQGKSFFEPAFCGAVFYTISRSLKAAGAEPTIAWIFELAAMFCGVLLLFRLILLVKDSISFKSLLKPKGIHGWLGEVNSFHPEAMGFSTNNNDGNGLLVGSLKRKWRSDLPVFFKGNGHCITMAGTEGGKTQSLSKGWTVGLGKHHNRIVTAKGADIAVSTFRYLTQVLKHHVVCIDPYRLLKEHGIESDDFNPCQILVELADKKSPDVFEKAREIAQVLIPELIDAGGDNKVFRDVSKSMIADILVHLAVEQAETGELVCNLPHLRVLMTSSTEDLIEIFQNMAIMPDYGGEISRAGKRYLSQFKNNLKSAQSFIVDAQNALAIFAPCTALGQSFEHSTFKPSDLKNPEKNMTVFIILPPEKSGLIDQAAGIILNTLCTVTIEENRFEPQCTIIADEFENLSNQPLPIIEKVLKIGRTRGVRLLAMCQDAESLKARYGQMSSMFWTQSSLTIAMDIRSVDEAENYSKRSGQRSIVSDSTNIPDDLDDQSLTVKEEEIPLLRQDEFNRLPKFTAAIWKDNNPPLILNLVHYKQVDPWVHQIDDVPGAPPEPNFPIKFKF